MKDETAEEHASSSIPIRDRLNVPAESRFDFVRAAVEVIDRVHGDGDLPVIPVVQGSSTTGGYNYRGIEAQSIEAATPPDRRLLSFAHEVGHFLDHQALGARGAFASASGRIDLLMSAINRSASIRLLKRRIGRKYTIVTTLRGQRVRFPVGQRIVQNLLLPEERFARAYAQYVAARSQDARMLQQLNDKQADLSHQGVYYEQWTDEDFVSIADGFDRLFRRRGWLR